MHNELAERAAIATRERRYEEARSAYREALRGPSDPVWRVHTLCQLAACHRLAGDHADAERAAREALELAHGLGDRACEAHAHLELATTLLTICRSDDVGEHEAGDAFSSAMDHVDHAASRYEELERVDFFVCLLTIAEACRHVELPDTAWKVYARITRELCEEKWASKAAGSDELTRFMDHLRGRAFLGLAMLALDDHAHDRAREFVDAAVDLFDASAAESPDPATADALEHAACLFATELGDEERAATAHAAAEKLR